VLGKTALIQNVRSRAKASAIYIGAALALAGAGTAAASTALAGGAVTHAAKHSLTTEATTKHATAKHAAAKPAVAPPTAAKPAPAKPTAARKVAVKHAAAKHVAPRRGHDTWSQVRNQLNAQTNPAAAKHGLLPQADRLTPVGTSGPQSFMPITHAQYDNAATIVKQTLGRKMGVRSAVIAVATAMQESTLSNINYGTSDSLGLFQQRPSMGWGTAQQIMDPAYAADAFLTALHQHQAADPGWAAQPLWATAQAVQGSAYPYAYAKWESQAAHLVATIATRVK
jgi:hypothetical protein